MSQLLISKSSFAVPGSPIVFPEGRIVEASHPMARRFPGHFVAVEDRVFEPSAAAVVEQATAAPGEVRAVKKAAARKSAKG